MTEDKIKLDELDRIIYLIAFFFSMYMVFYTLDPLWFIGWCLLDISICFHLYFLLKQREVA